MGAAANGFQSGLMTGGKAVVNGTASAVRATVTLGLVGDHWEVIAVTPGDRANGYATAAGVVQITGEFIIGVATGGAASALAKGGRVAAVAGKGLVLFDAAGNAVGVVTSASNIVANGPNAGNAVKFLAGAAGLGGNYAGLRGARGARSKGNPPDSERG